MILFGTEAGGSARALSLVHATRVFVIVSLMPLLITGIWGLPLDAPPGVPAVAIPVKDMAIMALCGWLGWTLAARMKLFGAPILGPMVAAAIASLAGLLEARPPAEAILAAQFFVGLGVGVHYVGVTVEELRRVILAALGYCVILAVISLIFAEIVALSGAAPQLEALLAFAPGGQAEMVVLAIVAGAEMPYVVTCHLLRLVVVIIGAPVAARMLR